MQLLGIDPGQTGYVVELDTLEKTARCMPLPWRKDGLLDTHKMRHFFDLADQQMIYVEKVGPDKLWSKKSLWSFACGYGRITQAIVDYPHQLLLPQIWQKTAHRGTRATSKAKDKSLEAFTRLNPNHDLKKLDHNLIDAFWIAYYGLPVPQGDWNFICL